MESEKTKRKPVVDMNAGNEPSSCHVNLKPRVLLSLNLVFCLSCDWIFIPCKRGSLILWMLLPR